MTTTTETNYFVSYTDDAIVSIGETKADAAVAAVIAGHLPENFKTAPCSDHLADWILRGNMDVGFGVIDGVVVHEVEA